MISFKTYLNEALKPVIPVPETGPYLSWKDARDLLLKNGYYKDLIRHGSRIKTSYPQVDSSKTLNFLKNRVNPNSKIDLVFRYPKRKLYFVLPPEHDYIKSTAEDKIYTANIKVLLGKIRRTGQKSPELEQRLKEEEKIVELFDYYSFTNTQITDEAVKKYYETYKHLLDVPYSILSYLITIYNQRTDIGDYIFLSIIKRKTKSRDQSKFFGSAIHYERLIKEKWLDFENCIINYFNIKDVHEYFIYILENCTERWVEFENKFLDNIKDTIEFSVLIEYIDKFVKTRWVEMEIAYIKGYIFNHSSINYDKPIGYSYYLLPKRKFYLYTEKYILPNKNSIKDLSGKFFGIHALVPDTNKASDCQLNILIKKYTEIFKEIY